MQGLPPCYYIKPSAHFLQNSKPCDKSGFINIFNKNARTSCGAIKFLTKIQGLGLPLVIFILISFEWQYFLLFWYFARENKWTLNLILIFIYRWSDPIGGCQIISLSVVCPTEQKWCLKLLLLKPIVFSNLRYINSFNFKLKVRYKSDIDNT